jgi:hypothetical protein
LIERMVDGAPHLYLRNYDADVCWKEHFEAEVQRVTESSPVPEAKWRSSRQGAEGRTFWEVNGPLMLKRYVDARPTGACTAILYQSPALEIEIKCDVPTAYGPVPFVAKLDRVTHDHPNTDMVTIRDYKTSYERPTDFTQLGEYAWALRLSGAVAPGAIIEGTYFDARRGEWTTLVNLIAALPWDAFVYRVTAAYAQRLALTTGPTPARPSSYCGGCSVRYACPVVKR